MLSNTVASYLIPYQCTNDVLLKFLGIHCSLIKKHDFFVFLTNEGIFFATHDVKEEEVGGSDYKR